MPTLEAQAPHSELTDAAKKNIASASGLLHLILLRVADQEFGLDIHRIREIIRVQHLTPVPTAPSFVEGVIDRRGRLVPIANLRKRFGLPSADHTRSSRFVIVDLDGDLTGLEVDAVTEVLRVPTSTVEPAPRLLTRNNNSISSVCKFRGGLLFLLDVQRLLHGPEIATPPPADSAAPAKTELHPQVSQEGVLVS